MTHTRNIHIYTIAKLTTEENQNSISEKKYRILLAKF